MGVSLDRIVALFEAGYLEPPRPRVLDVGCSNLHSIDPERMKAFIRSRNPDHPAHNLDLWARFAAAGGVMDSEIGGINGAWLGDMLTRAGMDYTAFDIFPGYKTEIFDLNQSDLPEHHRERYDLVLNFGTTEHVLGQYNAFKVIHEATAVGGVVCHELPMTGHLDHGFYNYNPVLLLSLAEANGYEILRLSFSGALAGESVGSELIRRYGERDYFKLDDEDWQTWSGWEIPTASLTVITRKRVSAPFRASLETSTTVGAVTENVGSLYGAEGANPAVLQSEAKARVHGLLRRLHDPDLEIGEMNHAYNMFVGSGLTRGFPLSLELRMLNIALASDETPGLIERKAVVEGLLRAERPVLKDVEDHIAAPALEFDEVEADFDLSGDEAAVVGRIVAAYGAYHRRRAVELFPVRLEAIALEWLIRTKPRDTDVLIRAGHVMAEVTPTLALG